MKAIALVVFLLLSFGAAAFGARFAPGAWYLELRKPAWNPPGWIFGPVWTLLYAAMAVAAWRVWRASSPAERRPALTAWGLQLLLNAAWSWLFFGLHEPGLAFAEILALWAAILATTILFFRRDRVAGRLMVPYLAWVSFAAALNFALWRMNG